MSGGEFDYKQWIIGDIADQIQEYIDRQGGELKGEDRYETRNYYKEHPDEGYYETFSPEVNTKMKEAVYILRKAHIYAQRIDWLLSDDDGEDSFLRRLEEELAELDK